MDFKALMKDEEFRRAWVGFQMLNTVIMQTDLDIILEKMDEVELEGSDAEVTDWLQSRECVRALVEHKSKLLNPVAERHLIREVEERTGQKLPEDVGLVNRQTRTVEDVEGEYGQKIGTKTTQELVAPKEPDEPGNGSGEDFDL